MKKMLDGAIEALENEDPEAALGLLEQVLREHPDEPDALLLKAEALVLSDRWEDAEELLEESARRLPKAVTLLLALADLIIEFHPDDQAALEEAHTMAVRGEAAARKEGLDAEVIGELRFLSGRALGALGRSTEAIQAYVSAREFLPDDPELKLETAMARFDALDFDDAKKELLALVAEAPDDSRSLHYLGLIEERAGRLAEAEKYFSKAKQLNPEEFPAGVHLSEEEFSNTVEKAIESLPERVRKYIANVPVMVEDLPSTDDLSGQDPPLSPLSLGMFRGVPAIQQSHFDPMSQLPSSIVLYQKNLERYAASRSELEEEIETTVLHEVGHYLGWDEEDLYERGLE